MKHSYHHFPFQRAEGIRMLVLDIDGVMTSGDIILNDAGEQMKAFHVRDGHGIKLVQRAGIEVGILTGRSSQVVTHRAAELGIQHVIQGSLRKQDGIHALCEQAHISPQDCAYMGDDVIDLPAMAACRLTLTTADAYPAVQQRADWISGFRGGHGAVRQACEGLILANQAWNRVIYDAYGVSPEESGWGAYTQA